MGKWAAQEGSLPAFEQEPEYQIRVQVVKDLLVEIEPPILVQKFAEARAQKQELEAQIKDLNVSLEAYSQLLCEKLDAQGLQKIQLDGGITCYTQVEPYSSVSDRAALVDFFRKKRLFNLLSVAWQTINSMNKERLQDGEPPLPGTSVYLKTSARVRGGSSNAE